MTESAPKFRVGAINPTRSGDSFVELEPLLPKSVELVTSTLDIREQTEAEFISVLDETEAQVDALAAQKMDLIHPIGAPVFMVHGYQGESDIIARWEAKHGIPIFTSGQSHVNSMRALGIRKFVGLSPLSEHINGIAAAYFRDAGFDVLALTKAQTKERDHKLIPWQDVYAQARELFEAHPDADGIYFLSSGWRILDAAAKLEADLGVPVDHPITARVWEIQRRLGLHEPHDDYGRLLKDLPPAVG